MLRAFQILCVLATLIIGAGCANPINARTADRYWAAGGDAEQRGDFVQARIYYHRMFRNAEMGFLGPTAEAYALYEWGRVSGYLGKTNDVEWAFPKVFDLIERASGKADKLRPPALTEFARYLHDTGQHARAVTTFRSALQALESQQAGEQDPVGFAEFLDAFAESLNAIGHSGDASILSKRSESLKQSHPGVAPKHKATSYPIRPISVH